jgi:hypothetical protein
LSLFSRFLSSAKQVCPPNCWCWLSINNAATMSCKTVSRCLNNSLSVTSVCCRTSVDKTNWFYCTAQLLLLQIIIHV